MTPDQFAKWKKHMRFSNRAAAEALGLSESMVASYATGRHRGARCDQAVEIKKSVRLACGALALGMKDYHGPE